MQFQNLNIMEPRNIKDVARYIGLSLLSKGLSVSPLKLQKMLYYTQSWYMVGFGRTNTLFADTPQAWVNGPVYPVIYQEYKDKTAGMCEHLHAEDFGCSEDRLADEAQAMATKMNLSQEEIDCIENVVILYGSKSQNQLIFLTHSESPWSNQREGLTPFAYSTKEISHDSMYDYYKKRYDDNRRKP